MAKGVIRSPSLMRAVKRINRGEINRIKKLITKIVQNPIVGKSMRYGRKDTREIYSRSFRLSYSYEGSTGTLILLELYHRDGQ